MAGSVRDVMTRTVVAAPLGASFKEMVRLMHEYRVGALPIVGEDESIVGVVTESDLLLKRDPELLEWHLLEGRHRREDRRKAMGKAARDLMSAPPVTIGPDATVGDAAHLMHERKVKHLPVVDEHRRIVGIVARVDLLAAFLRGDDAIADEVTEFLSTRLPDPLAVHVTVGEGVVRLEGLVEQRTMAQRIVDRVRLFEGVVAVEADRLDWEVDDTIEPVSPVPWVGF
ncbi:MAG: CBS domain-containing protein [Planctomycetaceae bacterium]